ncbi:MAG: carboxypeptidase-like regulatory domain-containing protein [Bacteroidales bacterium]|nr:carboxypeptidase-like regulatory domain-containing protein [Bacteroidales bacterium]
MKSFHSLLLTASLGLFLMLSSSSLMAQFGTVRGFVYEEETGEPVIFTNVYFYKTSMGTPTDENGYFAITRIPPGDYILMVTYIGFDSLIIPLTIKADEMITEKLFLKAGAVNLGEVSISAARQDKQSETQTSIIKVTPKEIQKIPSMGGQPDLAQYLTVLPGVIFSGDQGGQLYIRGGPPVQNKVLYDGMIVYNPFHSIGLFSVFDVDILKNADVYTGGFNAEYGGRISSIMDISTRDGNKNRFGGKVDVSTFGAKALLEGPIARQKTENSASASFILSVKSSYLNESSKIFYSYLDQDLPYSYTDIYGKISVNAPNGSKVNLFGFNFSDMATLQGYNYDNSVLSEVPVSYNWDSYGGGGNFIVIPGKSAVLLEGNFAYSYYKVNMDEPGKQTRSSSIAGFNGGLQFTYFFGKNALKYGLELSGYKTVFDFYNTLNRNIDISQNSTEIDLFVKFKWQVGKFIIEPGLRAQYYASLSTFSPEPRLAVKYNVTPTFRLKAAGGYYTQNLISTTNDLDVVNLFYGFLTGPENLPKKFNGKNVKNKLQQAWHAIFGFEWDLTNNLSVNIEGYYKYYPQLTNLNRNKLFEDNEANSDQPDYLKKDFIIETGDAEGVDISLKYDIRNFHFWGTYSLGFIHRFDGVSTYVPPFDRRHNVNLMGTYAFGKKKSWELNVRYNYGSGFPFTPTQGYYEELFFTNVGTPITVTNGSLGILYGDYNSHRLTYYSRLDFDFKKTFYFGKRMKLEIDASVTNLLNEKNVFYVDRITNTVVYQLPILPSLGLSFTF